MSKGHRLGAMWRRLGFRVAAVALTCSSAAVAAETGDGPTEEERAGARTQFQSGVDSFKGGDYAVAYEHFSNANSIIPTPHAEYWMAQCLDMLGASEKAIEAYETLLNNPKVSDIGPENVGKAEARLAELKAAQPPPAAAVPVEEPPPEEPESTPPPSEPPPEPWILQLKPVNHMVELGLFGGLLFVSKAHTFYSEGQAQNRAAFKVPSGGFGVRAGYFPITYVGIEAEYMLGRGSVESTEDKATFHIGRGLLVAQLPMWRIVPFVRVGAGAMQGRSDTQGKDTDFLTHLGLGGKLALHELVQIRLDMGLNLTEGVDGTAVHEEIMLGAGVTLGR